MLRRKKLEILEQRRKRHDIIWGLLRFIKLMKQFKYECLSLYDFTKLSENILEIQEYINTHLPSPTDFETAIRFCQVHYTQRKCLYRLDDADIIAIYNYQHYTVYNADNILHVLENEKIYWDNVIDEYKRKNAKIKRINYCIQYYLNIKAKPFIKLSKRIPIKIDEIIGHYKSLLTQIE